MLQKQSYLRISCARCGSIKSKGILRYFFFCWIQTLRTVCKSLYLKALKIAFFSKGLKVINPTDMKNRKGLFSCKLHTVCLKHVIGFLKCLIQISCMQNFESLSSQARLVHHMCLCWTVIFVWKRTAVRKIRQINKNYCFYGKHILYGRQSATSWKPSEALEKRHQVWTTICILQEKKKPFLVEKDFS